jgi:maltose/moltooligosaccharide transporter
MDASINISMEPFRAFVGDMLPPEQRTVGFSMQSFFIGTGAVIASALPYMMTNWFGISNIASEGEIPQSVKFAFYIGGAIFFLAVLYTVITTKEYSPEEMTKFQTDIENEKSVREDYKMIPHSRLLNNGFTWLAIGVLLFLVFDYFIYMDYGLMVFFLGVALFGVLQIVVGWMTKSNNTSNGAVQILNDLYKMPKTMIQLSYVQFFSWFALFAMWIYTTPAVTRHIYGTSDTASALYNEGADWVGVLMATYNGFAALMAFFLVWLSKRTSRKTVHAISLICGGLGLASFYIIKDPNLLLISELGIGLAWASILAMPYAMLTGSLPQNKLGVYMGIFNFFIVIPQITAAAILGFFVKNLFGHEAIYALLLGGFSLFVAAALVFLVDDKDA